MSMLEQFYWGLSLLSSMLFILVFGLSFLGGDTDVDGEIDLDVEIDDVETDVLGFNVFTLKNIIGYMLMCGWVGVSCIQADYTIITTIVVSNIAGTIMMFVMASLFYLFLNLQNSGTLNLDDTLDSKGTVYLPINSSRSNIGQIQVTINNKMRTMKAQTDDDESIERGSKIQVLDYTEDEILIVTKLK